MEGFRFKHLGRSKTKIDLLTNKQMKPILNKEHLNNAADNNKQPERRLTPRGRSAVVGVISNRKNNKHEKNRFIN